MERLRAGRAEAADAGVRVVIPQEDDGRRLLSFHGPVKIHERRGVDGQREYVVTPLGDAALLDALCEARVREAWYAGVDAALRVAEVQASDPLPLTLARLRAGLAALRHPKDKRDE